MAKVPFRQLRRPTAVLAAMGVHKSKGDFPEPHSVGDIIECLEAIGEEHGCVSVGDVVDALGTRTYAPFLIVPALVALTPLGGIPTVPTIMAVTIAIFAAQMLLGRRHFWIPDIIEERRIEGEKLAQAAEKMEGFAGWMDGLFHGRLKKLTKGPFVKFAALVTIVLCIAVPPLELVPFAAAGPLFAIVLIGLALLVRDGLVLLVATVLGLSAVTYGAVTLLS